MLVKNCIKFSNPFFLSNRKKMFFHEYKEQLFKETKEYLIKDLFAILFDYVIDSKLHYLLIDSHTQCEVDYRLVISIYDDFQGIAHNKLKKQCIYCQNNNQNF